MALRRCEKFGILLMNCDCECGAVGGYMGGSRIWLDFFNLILPDAGENVNNKLNLKKGKY